jgi:hypothetical protein
VSGRFGNTKCVVGGWSLNYLLPSSKLVGAPGGPHKCLGPAGVFSGPMISFAGLAAGADGDGSIMAARPER